MKRINEVLKLAEKQWLSKGKPLNCNRYLPKDADLRELECISNLEELRNVAKEAEAYGFLKIIEPGRAPCYTITKSGFEFLSQCTSFPPCP